MTIVTLDHSRRERDARNITLFSIIKAMSKHGSSGIPEHLGGWLSMSDLIKQNTCHDRVSEKILRTFYLRWIITLVAIFACASSQADSIISLHAEPGGTYLVPEITINGSIRISATLDSGASDFSIPTRVAQRLLKAGKLSESDYVGMETYTLADGSTVDKPQIRLRSVRVGTAEVHDVIASVSSNGNSIILLGQSFLRKFSTWQINNANSTLVLGSPVSSRGAPKYPHSGTVVGHDGGSTDAPCPPNYCKRLNGEEQLNCFRMCRARRKNSQ